VLSKASKGR